VQRLSHTNTPTVAIETSISPYVIRRLARSCAGAKRRFGYSRDHRPDCVQVVIALVVTPEGLPLAYDALPGNTRDSSTLRGFLDRIER
jgi:transposase